MIKNLLLLPVVLLFWGCSTGKNIAPSELSNEAPVVTGSVADDDAFQKGGALAFGDFKAGPGAAANDETDHLSAMLIKGMRNTLPQEKTNFSVLDKGQNNPDFVLEGYIEDYGRKGHFAHLSVDGEIWSQQTGEKIFLFQTSVVINLNTQYPKQVAYQMGTAIARCIGSYGSKE